MLENFNEDKRKNSMTQFSDFHTGWSIFEKIDRIQQFQGIYTSSR